LVERVGPIRRRRIRGDHGNDHGFLRRPNEIYQRFSGVEDSAGGPARNTMPLGSGSSRIVGTACYFIAAVMEYE
jgi:hypothetical protein